MHAFRFVAAAAAVALVSVAGCSSDAPPLPLAFVNSTMGPGTGANACNFSSGTWLVIQNSPGAPDKAVQIGSTSDKGAPVTASCQVHSNGDGSFAVTATATLGGLGGGGITVKGTFTPMGTQMNIHGVLTRGDTGTYSEDDCSVTYGPNMGVASGRVWGNLNCTNMSRAGESVPESCNGKAEFLFENCLE